MAKSGEFGFSRRDFLKGVASAAVTAGFIGVREDEAHASNRVTRHSNGLPEVLLAHPTISACPDTEMYWKQVRKAFTLSDDYIHMNTGTTGSQPLFSQVNLAVYNNYKSMDPRDWQTNLNADYPDLFPISSSILGMSAVGPRQSAVAAAYGANPDEIVLSYNTTDACNLIFAGTPWNPGDRIITTSMEHNALIGPIAWARDYHGVTVSVIEIPSNFTAEITVAEVCSWFETELGKPLPAGAKQYIAISEVFYKNGLRMPIKQICQRAKSYGAYTIVDAAHSWGMLPVNCHDYEADFICGAGHKWLCGGPGTGIFYTRTSGPNLPPYAMGNFFVYGNQFQSVSPFYNTRSWPNAYTQVRGEFNTPALYAMTDSFSYFDHIGIQKIYDRGIALSTYLKQKIENKWGPAALWVHRNPDPSFATFLTSFNPFRDRNESSRYSAMNSAISAILGNLSALPAKIYIRSTTWRDTKDDQSDNRVGFRISTHAMYNNFAEIDYMFDQLVAQIDASGLAQLG
ncbi:MAG: aminotransferase class V-fold PLP-dependent enzyme [Desulfuromonadaceae bacterium]|nr:aminotransferase class V-fold PLP-dependent enzyme [Desulfuromonadaceae bacterium]